MDAMTENHLDFAARIARIEKGVSSATQLLYVGVDEVYAMPRRDRRPKPSQGKVLITNVLYPVSLVAAVILGAVSHGIGQVARFYVSGVPDLKANPDVEMLVQIILGVAISMVLGFALGLNSRAFTTLKSIGVICGMLFFHNAVHIWPRHFAALTSELWVNQMVTHTKEFSLMWRGITFLL
jgi:hypothetical protein